MSWKAASFELAIESGADFGMGEAGDTTVNAREMLVGAMLQRGMGVNASEQDALDITVRNIKGIYVSGITDAVFRGTEHQLSDQLFPPEDQSAAVLVDELFSGIAKHILANEAAARLELLGKKFEGTIASQLNNARGLRGSLARTVFLAGDLVRDPMYIMYHGSGDKQKSDQRILAQHSQQARTLFDMYRQSCNDTIGGVISEQVTAETDATVTAFGKVHRSVIFGKFIEPAVAEGES